MGGCRDGKGRTMPDARNRKLLEMLAGGGATQDEIAAALHVSKRDVSAASKALRERGLTAESIAGMDGDGIDALLARPAASKAESPYLRSDIGSYVERKERSPKLPAKLFWMEC